MTVARKLASFVIGQRFADLPAKAVDYAEMLIASTIASAALGSTLDSSRIVREVEVERGGKPEATLWFGAAEKLPMAAVARVNALMSDAAASDDSDLRNIVHQGTTVSAASLAVGEALGRSGEDVVAAVVMGYESAGRISTALYYGHKDKGFHGCIIAAFGAAGSAARLLKLTETETVHAFGLTATTVGGLSAAANTSLAREYIAGHAAMVGVMAAQAAAKGYAAEEKIFEVRNGYFDVFGQNADVEAVTRDFGRRWNILTEMGIKLVPGGSPNHAVAEAAAKAAQSGDVKPDDVETIDVSRPGYQGFHNAEAPTDLIGIAHSAFYFAAAGVADRNYTWDHAFEQKIMDPVIRALMQKVQMVAPPTEYLERYRSGAIVTIRTKQGRSFSSTVYAPKGAAILGISWNDVEEKYRTLLPHAKLSPGNLDASMRVIRRLRDVSRISELTGLLR